MYIQILPKGAIYTRGWLGRRPKTHSIENPLHGAKTNLISEKIDMDIDAQKNKKKQKRSKMESVILLRVTKTEHDEIAEKAKKSGRTISALIRDVIKKTKAPTLTHIENERHLIREIARIGNNLNQLARIANTLKSDVDGFELLVALKSIESEVQKLTAAQSHILSPSAPVFNSKGS